MKKTRIAMGLAIAATTFISCNRENQESPLKGITSFEATADALEGKAELAYHYDVLWQTADKIAVKDQSGANSVFALSAGEGTADGTFTLSSGTAPAGAIKAYYPSTLVDGANLVWPEVQEGTVVPMYAEAASGEGSVKLGFNSLGAMMRIFFSTSVSDINLATVTLKTLGGTPAPLSGAFTVNGGKAVIGQEGKNSVTLKLSDGGVAVGASAKVFDFAIPAGTYADGFELAFKTTDGLVCKMTSANSFEIAQNSVNVLVLNGKTFRGDKPADAVNGVYTVDAEGHKVYFAKGNLKYDAVSGKWGFLDKQYDYQTTLDANVVTLFTWGLGTWSTNYLSDTFANSQADFVDWGTAIDSSKGTWRTLTKSEWQYVLWTRGDNLKVFRADVKVCGVDCIVTAPDGNTVDIAASYTESEWAAAEEAGFVCLPNAGYRSGSSIDFSYGGYYWSSTQSTSSAASTVNFKGTTWKTGQDLGKKWSSAVRLVSNY